MRILLIDDSAADRDLFSVRLAEAGIGFAVLEVAETAEQGARLLGLRAHDIYFIDYRLPDRDGLELVRAARGAGLTAPIIVLTGFSSPEIDAAAEAAGASDYLPKDAMSPALLSRAVRYALRNAAPLQAARVAEERFRQAQDIARIGTWDWDVRANTKYWSPSMRDLYGLDPAGAEPIRYDTWRLAVHPEDRDKAEAALAGALIGSAPYSLSFRILRPDRERPGAPPTLRWISTKGEVIRDGRGAPLHMLGVNIDVTDQHDVAATLESCRDSAVAGLQASEARFQAYFDHASEFLFDMRRDPAGEFRYEAINRSALDRFGLTLDAVKGRTPVEVRGPEIGGMIVESLRGVYETGEPVMFEPSYETAGGQAYFLCTYVPLRDEAGDIIGVLCSVRDMTERVQLETNLRQSQKMEALGQLAGGITHDFNNLLTGMLGAFEALGRQVATDKGRQLVEHGKKAIERAGALTTRLLAFARQQPLNTEPVDLNASIEDIGEMLLRTLGADVRIGKDLDPELWLASTDHNQIELAILNLGINARDAMPLGGALTISTRNETLLEARDGIARGDYVAVAITDTGTGMSPEVLARVTEPFFTTKGPGKGTGLGLSMVAGVTQQLGGGMTISSEVGRGTCVTLLLPRAEVAEPEVALETPLLFAPVRLLLVDDDQDTQSAVAAYAVEAGHSVVCAGSSRDALMLLEVGPWIDLMIIDSSLPGMKFDEFVRQATQRQTGLPILAISGHERGPRADGIAALAKPFRQDEFLRAIAALIEQNPRSATIIPIHRKRVTSPPA